MIHKQSCPILTEKEVLVKQDMYFVNDFDDCNIVIQSIKETCEIKTKSLAIIKSRKLINAAKSLNIQIHLISFDLYTGIYFYLDDVKPSVKGLNNSLSYNIDISSVLSFQWKRDPSEFLKTNLGIEKSTIQNFDGIKSIRIAHSRYSVGPTIASKYLFQKKNIKHVFDEKNNYIEELQKFLYKIKKYEILEVL